MFYLIFLHGNVYKENEQNPSEPTTKESYDMPKTQVQTPNRFEFWVKYQNPPFQASLLLFIKQNKQSHLFKS